jgi:hypothetical protein
MNSWILHTGYNQRLFAERRLPFVLLIKNLPDRLRTCLFGSAELPWVGGSGRLPDLAMAIAEIKGLQGSSSR